MNYMSSVLTWYPQVITQIISAEEFWQNHAAEYVNKNSGVKQEVANELKYIEIVA